MDTSIPGRALRAGALWAAAFACVVSSAAAQEVSGPDVWAANCGSCHRLRSLETFTASQWNSIATHMALVARLTPAETRAVREFLVSSARGRQAAATMRELMPGLAAAEATSPEGGANALAQQPAQATNPRLVTGRDIYRSKCAACHGAEGRGNGPAASAMNPRPTDFTDAARRQATTDFAVGEVIGHGQRSMPAFGQMLSRVQIDSLIAHLKTFRR